MNDQPSEDNTRNTILAKLRQACGSATHNAIHSQTTASPLLTELHTPRTTELCCGNINRFKENLVGNEIRVDHVEHPAHAIPLIADFIRHHRLRAEVKGSLQMNCLEWQRSQITLKTGGTEGDDPICVSQAYAGIEDTGTLVMLSSNDNPTLLNFLPDHHIVFVSQRRVLSTKAELWNLLRQEQQPMPRAINLISGPSRTADIEQTIQLGAHGPRSLWVFLTTTP